jgi:hypothetical protein
LALVAGYGQTGIIPIDRWLHDRRLQCIGIRLRCFEAGSAVRSLRSIAKAIVLALPGADLPFQISEGRICCVSKLQSVGMRKSLQASLSKAIFAESYATKSFCFFRRQHRACPLRRPASRSIIYVAIGRLVGLQKPKSDMGQLSPEQLCTSCNSPFRCRADRTSLGSPMGTPGAC